MSQPRALDPKVGSFLDFQKSRLKSKGGCAFAIKAPRLWNYLPEEIRLVESVTSFKSLLKANFYRHVFM